MVRLRIIKSNIIPTSTKPWRVLVYTPAGWTNMSGACFPTQQDAVEWVCSPNRKPRRHVKEFLAVDSNLGRF